MLMRRNGSSVDLIRSDNASIGRGLNWMQEAAPLRGRIERMGGSKRRGIICLSRDHDPAMTSRDKRMKGESKEAIQLNSSGHDRFISESGTRREQKEEKKKKKKRGEK
jgi:hypothetical protein